MEYEIKRFNIWSAAKIVFIIFIIIGILFSLFYLVVIGIFQNFIQSIGMNEFEDNMPFITGFTGIIVIVFFSFFYAIFATIFTILILGLYNIIAGFAGGIKIDVHQESVKNDRL